MFRHFFIIRKPDSAHRYCNLLLLTIIRNQGQLMDLFLPAVIQLPLWTKHRTCQSFRGSNPARETRLSWSKIAVDPTKLRLFLVLTIGW